MATRNRPLRHPLLVVFVLALACLSIMAFGGELAYAMSN